MSQQVSYDVDTNRSFRIHVVHLPALAASPARLVLPHGKLVLTLWESSTSIHGASLVAHVQQVPRDMRIPHRKHVHTPSGRCACFRGDAYVAPVQQVPWFMCIPHGKAVQASMGMHEPPCLPRGLSIASRRTGRTGVRASLGPPSHAGEPPQPLERQGTSARSEC